MNFFISTPSRAHCQFRYERQISRCLFSLALICSLGIGSMVAGCRPVGQENDGVSGIATIKVNRQRREAAIDNGLLTDGAVVLVSLNDRNYWQTQWRNCPNDPPLRETIVALGNDASHWATYYLQDDRVSRPCRIVTFGSSMLLARALSHHQIDATVDTNGYGTGYRAVEMLSRTPQTGIPRDSEAVLQIAGRVFQSSGSARYFLFLRKNLDQNGESYVANRFVSTNVKRIRVAVPRQSEWWLQFEQGCRKAALDCGVELGFDDPWTPPKGGDQIPQLPPLATRIVRLTWDAETQSGLIDYNCDAANNGLVLKSSASRMAKSLNNALMSSGSSAFNQTDDPEKIWLLHSQADRPLAREVSRELTRLFQRAESNQ